MKKYYSLTNILKHNADYNIIIGERSNGKTYAVLKYMLKNYINNGEECVILRRWKEDIIGKRAENLFNSLINNNEIAKLSDKYTTIVYRNSKYYLAYYDDDHRKFVLDSNVFCHTMALNDFEHDKGNSFPKVTTLLFDEFLTRKYYLPDEFVIFMNVISTIVRDRDNLKIFMVGNTVNKYCPYFGELGLKHVDKMEQGKIDVYNFSQLKIAFEYCGNTVKKASDKYFSFDNPKLHMITSGKWELAIYPHLPTRYEKSDVIFKFFIKYSDNVVQCDIVQKNDSIFGYCFIKTTPLRYYPNDIIYQLDASEKRNVFRNILGNGTKIQSKIRYLFINDLIFYQSNDVGEIVRNYILSCTKFTFQ